MRNYHSPWKSLYGFKFFSCSSEQHGLLPRFTKIVKLNNQIYLIKKKFTIKI